MSDRKDPIADAFSLTPMNSEIVVVDAPSENAESYDVETARQNIHHLIQKGNQALDEVLQLAVQSQTARSFEVATNLIKALAEVNKDLLDIHEKKRRLMIRDEPTEQNGDKAKVINGSTADLQDMLEKMSGGKK